jgi:ubiquitin carboxyl-terminal hydrolase 9/13
LYLFSLYLDDLPKILVIQLKRFKVHREMMKKVSFCVNFPLDLNLNFLMSANSNISNIKQDKENKFNKKSYQSTYYKLNSFIVHLGQGMNHGHYYSLIKAQNNWYKIDDDVIKVTIHYNYIILNSK